MCRLLIAGLITVLLAFAGCTNDRASDETRSVEQNADPVAAQPSADGSEIDLAGTDAAHDSTLQDAVPDDSLAKALGCQCQGWLKEASTQIPVAYSENRRVLLCAHVAEGRPDSLAAYDFGVFECGGPVHFESKGATEYVVDAHESPLTISEHQRVPSETSLFESQSVVEYTVKNAGDRFRLETSVIYDPPRMSPSRVHSVKRIARRIATTPDSARYSTEDVNREALVAELF